jgi:hypothetical protein
VDLCLTKGIPQDFAFAKSYFYLSSDHSAILITVTADALHQEMEPIFCNRHTNWDEFGRLIKERLTLNVPLKTEDGTEAAAAATAVSSSQLPHRYN